LAKKKAHNWRPPHGARAGSVDPAPLNSLTLTADDFLRPWFNEMVSHDFIRMSPGGRAGGEDEQEMLVTWHRHEDYGPRAQ
jgi:hypothetical protein